MNSLVKVQTTDRNVNQLQNNIANSLNPLLQNPFLFGLIVQNVSLSANATVVINHGLGRVMLGWSIVDCLANADIPRRVAAFNDATLSLVSTVDTVVNIYCF